MKTLIIGGVHGNEPLGIELVRMLQSHPLPFMDAVIANPRAAKAGKRFVEEDLNRVFPGKADGSYEQQRAKLLNDEVKQYNTVLDFHNTLSDQPACGFVGYGYDANLLAIAVELGLMHVIEVNYDCINKYAPNCLSVEVCQRDSNVSKWYGILAAQSQHSLQSVQQPIVYRYLRRVTWSESKELAVQAWQPFHEISGEDKRLLGVIGNVCPIFIGSTLTEYYATLVERIGSTFDTIETKGNTNDPINSAV